MDLSWITDFLALSATGNFSSAARQRHVTQPAFSRRIRLLERWLGVALFDRSTHPCVLTEAGQWFHPVAEDILRRVTRAREEAKSIGGAESSTLRFAATHVLSLTFFPSWLRGLESRLRIGRIQLVSDSLQACEDLMLRTHAQFLLCHCHSMVTNRLDARNFQSMCVGADLLVPVAAPNRLGRPRFVFPDPAGNAVPALVYSPESGLGRIMRTVLEQTTSSDARLDPVFTSHLATVLKAMALDGRGIAWLPQSLIRDDLDSKKLVDAGAGNWRVPMEIRLFRYRASGTPASEGFWQIAQNYARKSRRSAKT